MPMSSDYNDEFKEQYEAHNLLEQCRRVRAWIPCVGRDGCLYSFNVLPNKHFPLTTLLPIVLLTLYAVLHYAFQFHCALTRAVP
eukprot:1948366-Rhodomonas_salina.1